MTTERVTLLFTDIEGSTRLFAADARAMMAALIRYHKIVAASVRGCGGQVVKTQGDGVFATFECAADALLAVRELQRELHRERWPTAGPVRVRAGLHHGRAYRAGNDYFGAEVARCARLCAAANGGQSLITQDAVVEVAASVPEGVSLRALGTFRLRDLLSPLEVYEVVDCERREVFPPVLSIDRYPNNIPTQLTSFVGRQSELAEIERLIGSERIVSVLGPGGSGKSRLAFQASAELLGQFPDGVWVAELGSVTDPRLLPATLMAATGLREDPDRSPEEALVEHLRSKRSLVLLDGCEHLVDACARLVASLASRTKELRIIATSREPLGVPGERRLELPTLPVPPIGAAPETALEYESVRLFVERARLWQSDFELTERCAASVARLCRRLDGLPLAIELAAAQARYLSPVQIEKLLARRFDLLKSPVHARGGHATSLRQTLDWSFDLLTPDQQEAFCETGVFAGSFDLDAFRALRERAEAPRVHSDPGLQVAELVDKSLVRVRRSETDDVRYTMLESIREYARLRLAERGAGRDVRGWHAGYFLERARRETDALLGDDGTRALADLDADHDDFRAALDWCAGQGSVACGLGLAAALWPYWHHRGFLTEGRAHLEGMLSRCGDGEVTDDRAEGLRAAGILAYYQGDYPRARKRMRESLEAYRRLGNEARVGDMLNNVGTLERTLGNFVAAKSLFEECLAVRRNVGDERGLAASLHNLGLLLDDMGDYAGAESSLESALHIYRRVGGQDDRAETLEALGVLAFHRGDYTAARERIGEALEAFGSECPWERATCLRPLAYIERAEGRRSAAEAACAEELSIMRGLGDRQGEADALMVRARLELDADQRRSARRSAWSSARICGEIGDRRGTAHALDFLGRLVLREGNTSAARRLMAEALDLRCRIGDRRGIVDSIESVARIAAVSSVDAARDLGGAACRLRRVWAMPLPPLDREALAAALGPYLVTAEADGVREVAADAQFQEAVERARLVLTVDADPAD